MAKKISKQILRYTALFEPCEEGGFTVTVPKLPGVVTEADTFEEATENIKEAIAGYISVLKEEGMDIPDPDGNSFVTPVDVDFSKFRFAM